MSRDAFLLFAVGAYYAGLYRPGKELTITGEILYCGMMAYHAFAVFFFLRDAKNDPYPEVAYALVSTSATELVYVWALRRNLHKGILIATTAICSGLTAFVATKTIIIGHVSCYPLAVDQMLCTAVYFVGMLIHIIGKDVVPVPDWENPTPPPENTLTSEEDTGE